MSVVFESAKLMSKGQVTIPIDIRKKMNIVEGDQLVFLYENDRVIMMNSGVYAMKLMQDIMKDEAKNKNIKESDISNMVKESR